MGKSHNPLAEPSDRQEGVGQRLRKAREANRISIASAAASLHLPPRVIVALEESDFGQFEPVYVRGYLRNYARLLELSAEPLIESYNRALILESPPVQPAIPNQPYQNKSPQALYVLSALVVLPMILWGIGKVFLIWRGTAETLPPVAEASAPAVPSQDAQPALVLPGQSAESPKAVSAEIKSEPLAPVANPAPVEVASTNPSSIPAKPELEKAPPSPATGQGPDSIALHLSAAAWVSVRDQTGHRLVYENLPAGTERVYSGVAPFAVVLGNAPATKVEFNGQPYEPAKAKAGTVARFMLGNSRGEAAGTSR